MPATSAAFAMEDPDDMGDGPEPFHPSGAGNASTFRRRYNVHVRRSVAAIQREARPGTFSFAAALLVVGGLFALIYVVFWVLATRGGFERAKLEKQIEQERVVQAELEAVRRRLQSPGPILDKARATLGMVPAERQFIRAGESRAQASTDSTP